ncbi:MAG: glycosyl hydrolase 53 family protein [Polyangiaceae bacterium]
MIKGPFGTTAAHRTCLFALLVACGAANSACGDAVSGSGGTGGATTTTSSETTGQGGTGGAEPFRIALSPSPFSGVLFANGASFTDGTDTASDVPGLTALYMLHGANEMYARISTEKKKTAASDDHSLETALARAKLAKDLGMPFNPELGLWKHYGDISCEPGPDFAEYPDIVLPGLWHTLTDDQMAAALQTYGADVAADVAATGATIDYWDIGNEVDLGVAGVAPQGLDGACATPLLPVDSVDPEIGNQTVLGLLTMPEDDRIAWLGAHVWPHEAKLLAAVQKGIRAVLPDARFATHMSQSLSPKVAVAFYQAMADGGFSVDRIGFSYYPTGSTGPSRAQKFKDTVAAVHEKFGRPVFIAEVAYLGGSISTGPYASWTTPIPKYPIDEDGQAAFLHDLTSWAAAEGLAGIRPWAPEVIVAGWEGFALFAPDKGVPYPAKKALAAIADGAKSPDSSAFADQ